MESHLDGMVYYCELPECEPACVSEFAWRILKRGFREFFHIEMDAGRIRRTERGKPYYEDGDAFQFNISHCRDAVVVAVARRPVGVDAEGLRRVKSRTAAKCCGSAELSYVYGGQAGRRAGSEDLSKEEAGRFLQLWTLKESHAKLTGEGLRIPFCAINFELPGAGELKERQAAEVFGGGAKARYFLYPAGRFCIALAASEAKNAAFAWKELERGRNFN